MNLLGKRKKLVFTYLTNHKETTNIPSWSDENYKNTTTKDEKDILNQKRSKLLARLKEKSN